MLKCRHLSCFRFPINMPRVVLVLFLVRLPLLPLLLLLVLALFQLVRTSCCLPPTVAYLTSWQFRQLPLVSRSTTKCVGTKDAGVRTLDEGATRALFIYMVCPGCVAAVPSFHPGAAVSSVNVALLPKRWRWHKSSIQKNIRRRMGSRYSPAGDKDSMGYVSGCTGYLWTPLLATNKRLKSVANNGGRWAGYDRGKCQSDSSFTYTSLMWVRGTRSPGGLEDPLMYINHRVHPILLSISFYLNVISSIHACP